MFGIFKAIAFSIVPSVCYCPSVKPRNDRRLKHSHWTCYIGEVPKCNGINKRIACSKISAETQRNRGEELISVIVNTGQSTPLRRD